jgi:hypothetical protein
VVYSSATDQASALRAVAEAKAQGRKVISRDVNVQLQYSNQGDSTVQTQNSTVSLLFTPSIGF